MSAYFLALQIVCSQSRVKQTILVPNPNFFRDISNNRTGFGTNTPDGIVHIDNGTSNTDLIIDKDDATTSAIAFHNAGASA